MTVLSPFGERSLTLVAADFEDRTSAERAAETLKRDPELDGEVAVIRPGDPLTSRKLEPEQRGIWWTLVRSHIVFGIAGAAAGAAIALMLIGTWAAAADSPGFVTLFVTVMGAFFGMMIAGLVTLRPDHGIVIRQVREALGKGRYAVVVRPLDELRAQVAMARLRRFGAAPMRSL
jgi:hypothetical protein